MQGAPEPRPRSPLEPAAEWHSRGRLPHWEAGEVAQSVTFRLADSLPREVLAQLGARASSPRAPLEKAIRHRRFEALLDAGLGEPLLADPKAAAIVQTALLHFDSARYRLHAWCVMPNHVHVLATPAKAASLSRLVHSWKSFTVNAINARLQRQGLVWAEEYFDRAIRNAEHFEAALGYIKDNPVKAGLCAAAQDWPWSSAGFIRGLEARAPSDATSP